jgi:hypothetical protein
MKWNHNPQFCIIVVPSGKCSEDFQSAKGSAIKPFPEFSQNDLCVPLLSKQRFAGQTQTTFAHDTFSGEIRADLIRPRE